MGIAVTFATGPIGITIIGIAALIALAILFASEWDETKSSFINSWNEMVVFVENSVNKIINFINKLAGAFNKLVPESQEIKMLGKANFTGAMIGVNPQSIEELQAFAKQSLATRTSVITIDNRIILDGEQIGRSQRNILGTKESL